MKRSDNKRLCPSVDERNADKRVRVVARRTKSAQAQQESLANRVRGSWLVAESLTSQRRPNERAGDECDERAPDPRKQET